MSPLRKGGSGENCHAHPAGAVELPFFTFRERILAGILPADSWRFQFWKTATAMKRTFFMISTFLFAASCFQRFNNLHTFTVNHDKCKGFFVIADRWDHSLGYIDEDGNLRLIRAEIDRLGAITDIIISPESKKAIIDSNGEGVQHISVYGISDLVDDAEPERIKPVRTLDLYPTCCWNIRWIDEDCIEFASDADFREFDKELRRGKYTDMEDQPEWTWRWHLNADSFEETRSGRLRPRSLP
jgi:hypothetical protein